MRKIALMALVCGLAVPCFSFFPFFYGARSLALGYSSLAFNYDVNALYLNPALLTQLAVPLGGYQYGSSSLDFRDISGRLAAARAYDLEHFQALTMPNREAALAELNAAFGADAAINGFRMHGPGYAAKGYALSMVTVDAALVRPLANPVLAKPVAEVSDGDIASLRVRFTGFHYKDYSLAIAFPVSQGLAVGATLHYLKGKHTVFDAALNAGPFAAGASAADLLQSAWSDAGNGFTKFNFDLGAGLELGQHFKVGLVMKNVGNPVIDTAAGDLRLSRRLVAGLIFRPDNQLGIYLDVDLAASDLFHDGVEAQPFSLGLEKGLFQNKLFLRAGLLSDLAAAYFVGRKANVLYGFGCGFNLGNFLVDLALGLDPQGRVKNLAVSGFYAIR